MNMMVKHALDDRRIQLVVGIVAFVAVLWLGWFLYSSYRNRINEQAQFAFAMQLENLERLRQDPTADKQAWETAERDFAQSYQEHSSSDLAPFYLAAQAESSWRGGKQHEALGLMEQAVNSMGTTNPLYYLYATKLQVMRISSEESSIREEGKRGLEALAQNLDNPNRGYAWYQLWNQAWLAGDEVAAQAAFTQLSARQSQGAQWSELAKAKMDFLA